MCGIAGFTSFAPARFDRPAVLDALTDAQVHRGPDGRGTWIGPHCALGHRRLSILDPAGGAQPMATPDRRFHLIFNGEIYNHAELRGDLESRGPPLRTASDTEVLLGWLARHGPAGLDAVNGMFAFALWDEQEQTLLLARDRLGEKPLFYALVGPELAFASELKALRRFPALDLALRTDVLSSYLCFGYISAPATIHRGIHKLEPGRLLRFTCHGARIDTYWEPAFPAAPPPPRATAAAELRGLLTQAVQSRTRSDAPWGVWLSGGVDSALVAGLAATAITGRPLVTFSLGFDHPSYDETAFARLVAAYGQTRHEAFVLTAAEVADLAPAAVLSVDEPFADASIVPTYFLARHTARTVKTVLGGDGGDELFLGYPAFHAQPWAAALHALPGAPALLQALARLLPTSDAYRSPAYFLRQFAESLHAPADLRLLAWLGSASAPAARDLLAPALQVPPWTEQAGLPPRPLDRQVSQCIKRYLQDGILVKTDRAAMAHSLEVRAPFLDHRLVEWALARSPAQKSPRGRPKQLLKDAFADLLPPAIASRRKSGFMLPLASYLRGPLRPLLLDHCSESAVRRHGLLNPARVARLVQEHLTARVDHRKQLWSVLCLQMWLDQGATASPAR